jgi:hypothetical protein
LLRLAVRAAGQPLQRKTRHPVTRDILDCLIATCDFDRLVDARDLAILMVTFGSDARQWSKLAWLRVEQLQDEALVPVDSADPNSIPLPCLAIHLDRTKTTSADDGRRAMLVRPTIDPLREWLQRADTTKGSVFRAIDRRGAVGASR